MIAISRTDPEVMRARWHEHEAGNPRAVQAPPRPVNLQSVLDLDELVHFQFRGRAYGVPPLPWRTGQRLLDVWLVLAGYGDKLTDTKATAGYFEALGKLSVILWEAVEPVSLLHRVLKKAHIIRNPFARASERELVDVALFCLGRRMKPTGSFMPGPGARRTS